jgi:hypothetical protein
VRVRISSVPGGLASFIRQQLAVLLAHGNEKLINGHRRVNRDFAAEEVLDVVLLCIGDCDASGTSTGRQMASGRERTRMAFGACSDIRAVRPLTPMVWESENTMIFSGVPCMKTMHRCVIKDKLAQRVDACM